MLDGILVKSDLLTCIYILTFIYADIIECHHQYNNQEFTDLKGLLRSILKTHLCWPLSSWSIQICIIITMSDIIAGKYLQDCQQYYLWAQPYSLLNNAHQHHYEFYLLLLRKRYKVVLSLENAFLTPTHQQVMAPFVKRSSSIVCNAYRQDVCRQWQLMKNSSLRILALQLCDSIIGNGHTSPTTFMFHSATKYW